jgi:hypothetical protein
MRHDPDRPAIFRSRSMRGLAMVWLAAGLVAGAVAQVVPAAAGTDGGGYSVSWQGGASAGAPAILSISGSWSTPCTPTFDKARLSGADLRIDARAVLNLCTRQATPYAIELNPAAAVGLEALPPSIYHVYYYAADGTQAEPKLRAFSLVDTTGTRKGAAFAPETGFWWTTSGDRQGATRSVFSIEAQGAQLTAALMSYDSSGRGSWQFGTGALTGRTAHIPLLQIAGGSDPFSGAMTRPHGEAGMMLDLEFHSNSLATAWLSRSGAADASLQMQKTDLVRLPFAYNGDGSAWKGDWILAADADQSVPQRLHLDHVMALDATTFRLGDDAAGIYVDCALDSHNTELPPPRCILRRRDGAELGHFDAIAISRMDGYLGNGAALHLLRVSP